MYVFAICFLALSFIRLLLFFDGLTAPFLLGPNKSSTTCPADPADALAWSFQLSNFHDSSASIPMYGWLVCQIVTCTFAWPKAKEQ
jgi:hypothetical protein